MINEDMFKVTTLNGKKIFVNPDLVAFIGESPDTVLTLINGTKLLVKESSSEIIDRITAYKLKLLKLQQSIFINSNSLQNTNNMDSIK